MVTKTPKKRKTIRYTVKGQVPLYDQYGNIIQTATLIDAETERDVNWFKFWLADMAGILQVVGGAKLSVFSYIIDNVNRANNEFGGTMEEIAEKVEVNVKTVHETISLLLESNFMRKIRVAQYQVNPDIMAYGSSDKRGVMVVRYFNLSEKTPLEVEIDSFTERNKDLETHVSKKRATTTSEGLS